MGKGQKPMRGGGGGGGGATVGGDADDPNEFRAFSDGMTDVTYHTPAWHKARIDSLMAPRVSYEDWKLKQKEAEGKMAAVAENEEKNMREYRAMLDADRAKRLSRGTNYPKEEQKKEKKRSKDKEKDKKNDKKSKRSKKEKKEKDKKRDKKSKHKKRRRSDSSSSSDSSSDDDSSSSSEDERGSKKRKSSSSTKRGKDEPVRLSDFLRS